MAEKEEVDQEYVSLLCSTHVGSPVISMVCGLYWKLLWEGFMPWWSLKKWPNYKWEEQSLRQQSNKLEKP